MEKATDLPGTSGLDLWEVQDKIRHQESEFMLSYRMNTLGLMASGMAHEINQPLQIILGRAQNCITDIKRKKIGTEQRPGAHCRYSKTNR
jgi:C4-dicarboxylate-specific signal transduction histidine kinase